MKSFPKESVVRSEKYRRLVALLPCANCGLHDRSQAAHPPPTGKGIKQSDLSCFPLCAPSFLSKGCHGPFDRYELFSREETLYLAMKWGAQTRARISADGNWPARLPRFEEFDIEEVL